MNDEAQSAGTRASMPSDSNHRTWDESMWFKGAAIGRGPIGEVFLGMHSETGLLLAVKEIAVPALDPATRDDGEATERRRALLDRLKDEVASLTDIRHENLLRYLGSSSSAPEHLHIFMEYVPGGSLAAMTTTYGALAEPLVRSFTAQILKGLSYLHGRDMIHGNLKGTNVLVDNDGVVKLCDFFGRTNGMRISEMVESDCSVFWMAPEIVRGESGLTVEADVWSLGCVVVEMMTASHPFPGCSAAQAVEKLVSSDASVPLLPRGASEEARAFLLGAFRVDPDARPTVGDLISSAFVTVISNADL